MHIKNHITALLCFSKKPFTLVGFEPGYVRAYGCEIESRKVIRKGSFNQEQQDTGSQ
jgi:hypothetical protein